MGGQTDRKREMLGFQQIMNKVSNETKTDSKNDIELNTENDFLRIADAYTFLSEMFSCKTYV